MSEPSPISPILQTNAQAVRQLQALTAEEEAMQVETKDAVSQYFDVNPLAQAQRFRNFNDLKTLLSRPVEEVEKQEEEVKKVEKLEEIASQFEDGNDELDAKALLLFRRSLTGRPSSDEILERTLKAYPDPAIADEVIDFLIQTADEQTKPSFEKAKELLKNRYELEIKAGRNMGQTAREFAKQGLGSPVHLRDLYRDIIKNPREPTVLFEQLTEKFPYAKLSTALQFLFHSLGTDFRSKGPSIAPAELKRLVDETRSLQALVGVFRFFQSRMPLIESHFNRYGLNVPLRLNFEILSRLFIKILNEQFINPEKVLMTAKVLGISDTLLGQIIVFMQMRDAVRQVSLRYFRTYKHKEEVLKSFIDTIDKLEKDKKEKEEQKKKKK